MLQNCLKNFCLTFYFEIITDSQEVVKIIQSGPLYLYALFPSGTSSIIDGIISKWGNRRWYPWYSPQTSLMSPVGQAPICVLCSLCSFITCVGRSVHHHSEETECPIAAESPSAFLLSHTPPLPPIPIPWQPGSVLRLHNFIVLFMLYKWNHMYVTFRISFFHLV